MKELEERERVRVRGGKGREGEGGGRVERCPSSFFQCLHPKIYQC